MFCEKCGKEITKGVAVCPSCGFQPTSSKVRLKNVWRVTPVEGQVPVNGFATDCVVCETCMHFCSHYHEGSAIPALSRIVIDPTEFDWMMHNTDHHLVNRLICRQCPGVAPCMAACRVPNAMSRDDKTGAVLIDDEFCNRCRACERACPYQALWFSESRDRMFKCDLCGGDPQCVQVCPVSCLKYEKIA
ncbi:MAG: 4Fe-4S dicluster domain-containing protein [Chloroflexi bacterium]|nr:4Fe-4S dicluster domain-containing protein [Chloroflexota bacterium]